MKREEELSVICTKVVIKEKERANKLSVNNNKHMIKQWFYWHFMIITNMVHICSTICCETVAGAHGAVFWPTLYVRQSWTEVVVLGECCYEEDGVVQRMNVGSNVMVSVTLWYDRPGLGSPETGRINAVHIATNVPGVHHILVRRPRNYSR